MKQVTDHAIAKTTTTSAEEQKQAGKFKRFFKWVNKKVCATGNQIVEDEEDDVNNSSRKRVMSAPRSKSSAANSEAESLK